LIEKTQSLNYTKTLHFKFTELYSERQKITQKKHSFMPEINLFQVTKVVVIDDDFAKGWAEFYKFILSTNDIKFEFYDVFDKANSKDDLISELKRYTQEIITNTKSELIFIIDLRLHEDDFELTSQNNLSGILLVDFIKSINPGIQIVISTASNKVWNYRKCLEHNVKYFTVKESPETYNTRKESLQNIQELCWQIEKAAQNSFLASLYTKINELRKKQFLLGSKNSENDDFNRIVFGFNGQFSQLFNLLEIDPDKESIKNHCLILCFQILERFCDLKTIADFDIRTNGSAKVFLADGTIIDVISKPNNEILSKIRLIRGSFNLQTESANITVKSFEVENTFSLFSESTSIDTTSIIKFISILTFRYNIEKSVIEKLIELRYYRSNVAAHLTGNVRADFKLSVGEIIFFIDLFEILFNEAHNC